uniref:Uncharacterized protein n=1 Tax=viral metagenome TaxID=1070528 RepID=A0A6M3KAN1_9ZZZZ
MKGQEKKGDEIIHIGTGNLMSLLGQAKLEQAAIDQLNFDKERIEFWGRIEQARAEGIKGTLRQVVDLIETRAPAAAFILEDYPFYQELKKQAESDIELTPLLKRREDG